MAKAKNTTGGGAGGIEESFVEEGKAVVVTASSFDTTAVEGRDGSGPFVVLDNGVILPDGSQPPVGATFNPGHEKVATIALERWMAEGLVIRAEFTKQFKGEMATK